MFEELKEALAPHIVEVVMSLVTVLLGYATVLLKKWTGIQIEEKHRQALHSAIRTGVQMGLDKGLDRKMILGVAKDYAKTSVPDAIKWLVPGDGIMEAIALAKLREILSTK